MAPGDCRKVHTFRRKGMQGRILTFAMSSVAGGPGRLHSGPRRINTYPAEQIPGFSKRLTRQGPSESVEVQLSGSVGRLNHRTLSHGEENV
jgi:hypothetical protein